MVDLVNVISGLGKALPSAVANRQQIEVAREELAQKRADAAAQQYETRRRNLQDLLKDTKVEIDNYMEDLATKTGLHLQERMDMGEDPTALEAIAEAAADEFVGMVAAYNEAFGFRALSEETYRKRFAAKVAAPVAQAVKQRRAEQQGRLQGIEALARAPFVGAAAGEEAVAAVPGRVAAAQAEAPELGRAAGQRQVAQAQVIAGAGGPETDVTAALRGVGALPQKQLVTLVSPDGTNKMTLDENDPLISRLTARNWTLADTGQTININTAPPYSILDQESAKRLAERDATLLKTNVDEPAIAARRTKIDIAQMRSGLGGFETGAFGEFRAGLARLLSLVGVPTEQIPLLGNAVAADVIGTAQNRMVLEVQSRMKGATSDRDIKFAKDSVPGLLLTAEGNAIILEVLDRSADRDLQRQLFFETFLDTHDGRLRPSGEKNAFLQWAEFENANPIIDDDLQARIEAATARAGIGLLNNKGQFDVPQTLPDWASPADQEKWRRVDKTKLRLKTWDRATGTVEYIDQNGDTWTFRQ